MVSALTTLLGDPTADATCHCDIGWEPWGRDEVGGKARGRLSPTPMPFLGETDPRRGPIRCAAGAAADVDHPLILSYVAKLLARLPSAHEKLVNRCKIALRELVDGHPGLAQGIAVS